MKKIILLLIFVLVFCCVVDAKLEVKPRDTHYYVTKYTGNETTIFKYPTFYQGVTGHEVCLQTQSGAKLNAKQVQSLRTTARNSDLSTKDVSFYYDDARGYCVPMADYIQICTSVNCGTIVVENITTNVVQHIENWINTTAILQCRGIPVENVFATYEGKFGGYVLGYYGSSIKCKYILKN